MTEHDDDRALRLVPDPADDPGPSDADGAAEADDVEVAEEVGHDPLLARAERIADLPLDERPAAFDGLNRALVAELNQLEEG